MALRTALALCVVLAGCAPGTSLVSPDARDAAAFRDGDLGDLTACEVVETLDFVNASDTDAAALKARGVHSRAADHIEAAKAGPDAALGTADDVVFASLFEVDDVPYVGPVAMDQLLVIGADICAGVPDPEPPADATCAADSVLSLVNAPSTDAETLKGIGVHTRAADNIVATRNGPDGEPATADDVVFATLQDVDDVPYVGPVAMEALVAWGEAACRYVGDVVFSPQPYQRSHIARVQEEIEAAQTSIDVAMYSFSDTALLVSLRRAVERGVTVRFLFDGASEDRHDPAGSTSAKLEDMGIEVRWVNKIQHHKFAIIDGPRTDPGRAATGTLLSGSGNWSYGAATRFDENMLAIEGDPRLLLLFQREYDLLWDNSRPFVWNEDIAPVPHVGITDTDLEDAPGSDAVFTSANFRTYTSGTYGPTFATNGEHGVRDRLVELIDSAERSVWVASGHMRSRALAEALIAAEARGVDVRVYLDGQEYTSAWYWGTEVDDYDACMAAALDQGDRDDCDDLGLHFGYALKEAGVDLRYKYYAYRWDYHYADQMHHKYVIVDGETLATGSYNWSSNAEYDTFENVAILGADRYPALVAEYEANFESIFATGEAEDRYDELLILVLYGTNDVPLVFDPMALTWDQIGVLKDALHEACPAVDSDAFRSDPAAHTWCDR